MPSFLEGAPEQFRPRVMDLPQDATEEPAPLNGVVKKVLEEAENIFSTPPQEVEVFTFTRPHIRKGTVNGSHTEIFTGTQAEYHEHLRQSILSKAKRD